MASMLPPDPYKALGLTKDADAATIKSTYRKLALKCHPDKVSDESLKKQKQEEFHKIQQAYELIGDEDKRATYDAEVRLDQLRREKLSRGEPRVDIKTARYEVRTPAGATFTANGPTRYDDRKTSRSFEDDRYWDDRARKFDTYDPYPKHSSTRTSRSEKEPAIRVRVSSDRTRSDHKKTRDREERRDRSGKFVYVEDEISSNDEKARFESNWHRRSDEDDAKKAAADARRKAEDHRRSYEEPQHDRQRKLSDQTSEAMNHIQFTKGVVDPRPPTVRTSSSREIRPDTHERSSRRDRPEAVRRSSARPKEHRDRKGVPEIVEWGEDDRKVPSFKHSSSSPADIHVPPSTRVTPQRAYTEAPPREHRRTESSPTPVFRRSETMPSVSHSSSARKAAAPRSSTLRSSETLAHHEPLSRSPETTYPTIPQPQSSSSKKYYYSTSSGGVRLVPAEVEVANGHRTILHEPNRHRTRSPSPLSRPPMGPNAPKLSVPPTLGRSATLNVTPSHGDDRGRSRPALYGEIPKRENARRQPSYSPEAVTYSRKIGPEDIRWSRGRESIDKDREYARPTLTRPATFAY